MSQLWSGGQKGEKDRVDRKQHGGGWLKMKGKQLGGSHGRMSEPLQQIVVGGKRMPKPYVLYGMERYRDRDGDKVRPYKNFGLPLLKSWLKAWFRHHIFFFIQTLMITTSLCSV